MARKKGRIENKHQSIMAMIEAEKNQTFIYKKL